MLEKYRLHFLTGQYILTVFSNSLGANREISMATFAYGRVSTKDQTTDNQKLEIENAGFTVDFWFADEGVSGKTQASQRPQFKALLGQIRNGETLVVAKLDRLGRDAHDVGSTIKDLATRKIEVIVLQLGKMDLTSPAGKLMLNMLAAVAEMERDLLVERTQSGLARAKSQGKQLGRPSKTDPQQRTEILAELDKGTSVSELARRYNVSRANIIGIRKSQLPTVHY
jgi:putative DNA-invertase from lambdoid prophage Rac